MVFTKYLDDKVDKVGLCVIIFGCIFQKQRHSNLVGLIVVGFGFVCIKIHTDQNEYDVIPKYLLYIKMSYGSHYLIMIIELCFIPHMALYSLVRSPFIISG